MSGREDIESSPTVEDEHCEETPTHRRGNPAKSNTVGGHSICPRCMEFNLNNAAERALREDMESSPTEVRLLSRQVPYCGRRPAGLKPSTSPR